MAVANAHLPLYARRGVLRVCLALLLSLAAAGADLAVAQSAEGPTKAPAAAKKPRSSRAGKFKDFADVTKGAKKHEGLFNLYQKDQHLYAVIKSSQFNKPMLAPIAVARGLASAGMPLNFGDEWVIMFRRVGDRVQVIRKNVHYEAPKGTPVEKAVKQNYLDSVLMAIRIVSDNPPGGGVLVDFSDIFFTNFANLSLGSLDRNRTSWHRVKTFKNNVELQVKATFGRGGYSSFMPAFHGDDGVIDRRGVTVVLHYSLTKMPKSGYKPRLADQRVGHFINSTKNFGSKDPDSEFTRRINRWRLEKANSSAKLSPPKEQIVWWVEDNVPHEYRPYVEEGILEWNKAFRKIGFRKAIDVRWQQEGDDFEPEDINYCTFRWVTTPTTFAMSGLRANPVTGEMIDGDVVFDASWIRYWKAEYAFLVGMPIPQSSSETAMAATATALSMPLDVGEIISPIMAAKHGFGSPVPSPLHDLEIRRESRHQHDHEHQVVPRVVPSSWTPLQVMMQQRLAASSGPQACQYALAKRQEFRLAALAMAARADDDDDDDEKNGDDDEQHKAELPEEFIGQLIKEIVMHEVGHSLGLRHNFKASAMLSLDDVNDKELTREKGLSGSVMDYNPVNLAADPDEQGDFATTTLGPYDYWAIEYAYKPISGNQKKELQKIAARSPEPDLAYATDQDMVANHDPHVNVYDLGDDPLAYGKLRVELAERLLPKLDQKIIRKGESWARLRTAFTVLLQQYGNAAHLASSYVAGQHVAKHHRGDEETADPIIPVAGKKQREALEFVTAKLLSDKAFHFPSDLLRRLTVERWRDWGSRYVYGSIDYPIYDRILSIQRIVLNHCLGAGTLRRLQNQQLLAVDDEPLKMAEVFRTLTDGVWSEIADEPDREELEISLIRRNLQREHLRKLSTIVIGQGRDPYGDLFSYVSFYGSQRYPADARSLARQHLKEIAANIEVALERDGVDDTTRAHLEEVAEQIESVLEARLNAAGP